VQVILENGRAEARRRRVLPGIPTRRAGTRSSPSSLPSCHLIQQCKTRHRIAEQKHWDTKGLHYQSVRRLIFPINPLILNITHHAPGAVADFPSRIAGAVADGLDHIARPVPDFSGHIARSVTDDSAGLFDFSAGAQEQAG
jgi:hypothetical protein